MFTAPCKKEQEMASDKLKGTRTKSGSDAYSTSGPLGWRGPSKDHKAYSHRGKTAKDQGDAARNVASVEKWLGGRNNETSRQRGAPWGTHGDNSSVTFPKWASRDAAAGKPAKEPKRKPRTTTISAR
jgi:hypothetical protein